MEFEKKLSSFLAEEHAKAASATAMDAWEETAHKRESKGSSKGGQFAKSEATKAKEDKMDELNATLNPAYEEHNRRVSASQENRKALESTARPKVDAVLKGTGLSVKHPYREIGAVVPKNESWFTLAEGPNSDYSGHATLIAKYNHDKDSVTYKLNGKDGGETLGGSAGDAKAAWELWKGSKAKDIQRTHFHMENSYMGGGEDESPAGRYLKAVAEDRKMYFASQPNGRAGTWEESKHPRGGGKNKGQFAKSEATKAKEDERDALPKPQENQPETNFGRFGDVPGDAVAAYLKEVVRGRPMSNEEQMAVVAFSRWLYSQPSAK